MRSLRRPAPFAVMTALVLASLLVVSGCSLGGGSARLAGSPSAAYTPIADATLFADVARIPGVLKASLGYSESVENGRRYFGDITMAEGTTAQAARAVLDEANAILWQGRPQTDLTIRVVIDTPTVVRLAATEKDLGLDGSGSQWLAQARARYGAQPGTGLPPAAAPRDTPATP